MALGQVWRREEPEGKEHADAEWPGVPLQGRRGRCGIAGFSARLQAEPERARLRQALQSQASTAASPRCSGCPGCSRRGRQGHPGHPPTPDSPPPRLPTTPGRASRPPADPATSLRL